MIVNYGNPLLLGSKMIIFVDSCRLWGENGQQALEISHVCLINATIVGTEILKSLVLPGIRAFTIIDDHKITEDDFDSNFFLCTEGSIGQSRAKIAAQLLLEMNDDVKKGDYVEENFETLLDKNINYFLNFTLVIACGINNERAVNKLSKTLWSLNIPLLLVNSIGFLGYVRLQVREHPVLEAHPDNYLEDLRLDDLFPELKTYLDDYPVFESLSRKEISQVPSLVIIYKNLLKWREKFEKDDNEIPKNYKEKSQISMMIKDQMEDLKELKSIKSAIDETENDSHLHLQLELENFEEAVKLVNKIFFDSHKVPDNLRQLLEEISSPDSNSEKYSSSFWVMVNSLDKFMRKYNCLPLRGTIPDMNCGSEQYVQLQRIYKNKANDDVDRMFQIAQKINKSPNVSIAESDVRLFCKNVRHLVVLRTSPIHNELVGEPLKKFAIHRLQNSTDEEESENDELRFYILMRLVDRFHSKHKRFPGQTEDEVESHISELKVIEIVDN